MPGWAADAGRPNCAARPGRDLPLDALRGLASVSVLIFHSLAVFFPAALTGDPAVVHAGFERMLWNSPFWAFINGEFDVAIFFVLSGYILTAGYFQAADPRLITRRAIGRVPRLLVPAGASTLAVFLLLRAGLYRLRPTFALTGADTLVDSHVLFGFAFDAASLFDNLFWRTWVEPPDVTKMYNLVLWTMPIELWGSAIVFGAALVFAPARSPAAWLTGLAALLALAVPQFGVFIGAFVAGAALAAARPAALPAPLCWGIAGGGLILGSYNGGALFHPLRLWTGVATIDTAVGQWMHCAGAWLVVCAVVAGGPLRRLLRGRLTAYFGRLSFALYLVHQPVIFTAGGAVFLTALPLLGYGLAAAAAMIVSAAFSFGIAHLAERFIDRPAIRLSHWVANAALAENAGV